MANGKLNKYGFSVIVGHFLGPFIQVGILFACAGHINIPGVWLFLIVSFVGMFGGIMLVCKADPELLNVRGQWKKKKDTKGWDKILLSAFGLIGLYITPVIIGLDVGRFGWSQMGLSFTVAGAILFILGSIFITWAMLVNTHFEATVRIQKDRDHKVITAGPYKIVRHPGYVGAFL